MIPIKESLNRGLSIESSSLYLCTDLVVCRSCEKDNSKYTVVITTLYTQFRNIKVSIHTEASVSREARITLTTLITLRYHLDRD